MRVLMVTSEANPFIKTGGLGDVMGALPQSLERKGVEVCVVIPNYKDIDDTYKDEFKFVKSFSVKVGWREQYCGVFKYKYDGIDYYFLDNEYYFNRNGIYGHYDDAEKFAFFDRAALELIKEINWKPDIIQCNDWQTGMIPVLYKLEYENIDFYRGIKTSFVIHDILFQGIFPPEILPELFGYDYEPFLNKSLEMHGGVSFMKGGINYCDQILTVSPSYAKEIQTPEYGKNLDGLLRSRGYALKGILNGIDYEKYNPSTSKDIYLNYATNSIYNKDINKENLQRDLGLPVNKDIPIIGMVSKLTHLKGCDLVISMLDMLLQQNVQVVILGTGDYLYEETFKNFKIRYHDKVSVNIKNDNNLAHKIYAGADMIFAPSLYEACGFEQMIALRYGTLPIVREIGGLKDAVSPYNRYTGIGNGFGFKNYNANELREVTQYALEVYNDKHAWNSLVLQAMRCENSWDKAAEEYKALYKGLVGM